MSAPKSKFSWLDWIISIALVVTTFMVLTQAIPFIQLGWLHELGKKSKYNNLLRLSVIICGIILMLLRFRFSEMWSQTIIARFANQFNEKQLWLSGALLYLVYSANFIFIANLRHNALQTRAFDLGIFSQSIWTTLHGNLLFSSLKEHICLLGDHFSPLLLAMVPFYALWQDPRCLMFIQAICAGALIFPLIYLAKEKTRDPWVAFMFAVMFFFYLPTRSALRDDFHPEILIEALIVCAFIAAQAGKWIRFALLAVIIMSAKENMPGVVFILGTYIFIFENKKTAGFITMAGSVAVFLIETRVLVPMLNPDGYFYGGNFISPLHPTLFFKTLFGKESIEYFLSVFSTFAFLPLLHPATLMLTLPVLLQNLLSTNTVMRSFNYHYLAGLSGFLFISTICSFSALSVRFNTFDKNKKMIAGLLLAICLIRSGSSEYYFYRAIAKDAHPQSQIIQERLRAIPSQYVVLTHNNLAVQTSNRMYLYQFDYNEALTKIQEAQKRKADFVILDRVFWEGRNSFEQSLADFLSAGFEPQYKTNDFVLLKKSAPTRFIKR